MRVSSYDAAELEGELGPRDGTTGVTSSNRDKVQNWLVAQGVPSARVKSMRLGTLWKCYNKPRYMEAVLLHVRGECVPAECDIGADLWEEGGHAVAAAVPAVPISVAPQAASKAEMLASLIRDISAESVDEARVIELIGEYAPRPKAICVCLRDSAGEVRELGVSHRQLPQLLKACSARDHRGNRLNIWLSGPPGSGKTNAAEQVAEALGLEFYFNGAIDNEYKLLGFVDAQGRVISRPFRQAYEHGGVYLFDEIDASLPAALLAFNSATANGWCDFPDGKVRRHADCVIIAAGNTYGGGGTAHFTGRMKQDGAFLDRFGFISWAIDEALESELCPDREWCAYVQAVRARVLKQGLQQLVTPRASFLGAGFLAAGLDRETVIGMTLRKGMSNEQWESVA